MNLIGRFRDFWLRRSLPAEKLQEFSSSHSRSSENYVAVLNYTSLEAVNLPGIDEVASEEPAINEVRVV